MRRRQKAAKWEVAYIPTSAIMAFELSVLSWMLHAWKYVIEWAAAGKPMAVRQQIAWGIILGVSTIYTATKGRKDWKAHRPGPGQRIGVTLLQSLVLVLVVVLSAVFTVWLGQ